MIKTPVKLYWIKRKYPICQLYIPKKVLSEMGMSKDTEVVLEANPEDKTILLTLK